MKFNIIGGLRDSLLKNTVGSYLTESLFYSMEAKYTTLKTIYEIVKNEANPTTYNCTPAQVILRQSQPWDRIMQQMDELEAEQLITINRPNKAICITAKGIDKIKSPDVLIHS